MIHLYAYDHRDRWERWMVVWSAESVLRVCRRWQDEGLRVEILT